MTFIPNTYTVESVTSGHPDKLCDQIADAILDACLAQDPNSRVAVEVLGAHQNVIIAGEISTNAIVDYTKIAQTILTQVGYDSSEYRFQEIITQQSPEISVGVDNGGAGDQGIMYGFATDETPEYLPKGVVFAHALTKRLEYLRNSGQVEWLRPDGKSQVTIQNGQPTDIVLSAQHSEAISLPELRTCLRDLILIPVLDKLAKTQIINLKYVKLIINPAGAFHIGGFDADSGVTGRKTQVDTYGGIIPHGGGAFSGKDATKVDRSAAYMARFAAKNIVASGRAKQCLVSVAYAIGVEEPLTLNIVDENGNSLSAELGSNYDFRPKAIIERLRLREPIYSTTSSYGHFGKDGFSWEEITSNTTA